MISAKHQNTIALALKHIIYHHDGQMYGDLPYFTHPVDVAQKLYDLIGQDVTATQYVAALLHDIVEDCEQSVADVRYMFGDDVANIVALVTKDKALSYEQNIQRIIDSGNRDAMLVKLADNYVNYGGKKSHMTPERARRLQQKYAKSINALEQALWENENEQSTSG